MKNTIRALLAFLALEPAVALAQSAPANLPYQSVYGRLGLPGTVGPGQAIPFATLATQLSTIGNYVIGPTTAAPGNGVIFGASPRLLVDSGAPPVVATRTISTTSPLAGGGDLTANRTFSLNIGAGLTTSAGNLILANPSASTLGGTQSIVAASHQWINSISTTGIPALSQPAFSDLTGSAACSQLPALTGDIATTAGTCPTTLASIIAAGGPTGSATVSPIITYDAKGRLTAVSSATVTPAVGSVTGLGAGVATALGVNVGTAGAPVINGGALGTPSSSTLTNATGLPLATGVTGTLPLANGGANAALTASNGGIVWSNASQLQILAGTVTSGQCLLSGSSAAPTWGSCSGAAAVSSVSNSDGTLTISPTTGAVVASITKASGANLEAGASNKVLTADIIFDAEVAVTFSATQTLDFSTFLNARVTLTANMTSLTCSNMKASQSGTITFVQDATGSRTQPAAWCSAFRWTGGTRGVLSTAANAVDALFYQCVSTSICYVSLGKAQAN